MLLVLGAACVGPQVEIKTEFEVFIAGENEICERHCGGEGIGQASITIDPPAGELCYDIELEDIPDPIHAHIHHGGLEETGEIALDLEWEGNSSGGSKCLTDVDPAVLTSLQANPRLHYLNVHSGSYSDGAARGQFQT